MIKGFKILEYNDVNETIVQYMDKGALRGVFLGFSNLHEKYTMSLPGATDWTGSGGSGKTEVLLELLLNTSKFYGWKHLLYVPDVGTKDQIVALLIHKLTGKTFDKRFKNVITETEVIRELPWILEHFKILYKEDRKSKITPYQFWDLAVELHKSHGINTCTIDSWKDMKRYVSFDGTSITRDDLYLEDVLSYRNDLCDMYKIHFHIIIHPLKTEKDKNGIRLPATPYDLKGGTTWYDAGKVMVTIHRVDGEFNKTKFIVTKNKPDSVASLGETDLYFDKTTRRFYWLNDGQKVFSSKNYIKPIGDIFQENDNTDDESDVPF